MQEQKIGEQWLGAFMAGLTMGVAISAGITMNPGLGLVAMVLGAIGLARITANLFMKS